MIAITKDSFSNQVLLNNLTPKIVYVWAGWCSKCKRQTPILERLESDSSESINIYSVKADDEQNLVKELKVMAVPTLLLYSHGVLVKKMTGVKSPEYLLKQIELAAQFTAEEAQVNLHKSWFEKLFGQ